MTMELKIVSPEGTVFFGQAQKVFCRTVNGDVCVLPRHCNYCVPLALGEARVTDAEGNVLSGACAGGILTVVDGRVFVAASTFEWKQDIDLDRAKAALERAKQTLSQSVLDPEERNRYEAKLNRARLRIEVASL